MNSMIGNKNKELIRMIGLNPLKPDSFQVSNEPLMNNLFLWAEENIPINEIIQRFFNIKVKSKLSAVLLDIDLNNWIGLAASWQEANHTGQIRIDVKSIEFILSKAFGASFFNQPLDIKKINELELSILQNFLEKVEVELKKYWEVDTKHPYLMDVIYLVWLIESDEGEIGKIAFGVPASFRPKMIKGIGDVADINKLANTGIKVPVSFHVGTTKLSYKEIDNLENGDLLVFEDSDSKRLTWHFGEISVVLPESDHEVFLHDFNSIEELAESMTDKIKKFDNDPLSSLPLELSAEFQKVKIPLKQMLELKSGGVLPLGHVLETELTLTAQGKPVAKGELVIVGNQFGMRVSELLIGSKKSGHQELKKVNFEPEEEYEEELEDEGEEEINFEDELKGLEEN